MSPLLDLHVSSVVVVNFGADHEFVTVKLTSKSITQNMIQGRTATRKVSQKRPTLLSTHNDLRLNWARK